MSVRSLVFRTLIGLALALAAVGAATLAFAALSTGPTGEKEWYWENPRPQGNALNDISAPSGSDVWAVGGPGVILHSTDAGAQWEAQDPRTLAELRGVSFVGVLNGWAVGDGTTIRATTDGGSTWTTQTAAAPIEARSVSMATTQTGWIVGEGGVILKTTDGGSTAWTTATSPTTVRLNGVEAVDATHAWAVGGTTSTTGTILVTTDGTSWSPQTIPAATRGLNDVCFVSTQNGFVVGDRNTGTNTGTVLKTTNGGATWTPLNVQYVGSTGTTVTLNTTLYSVSFRDPMTGWMCGAGGLVLFTNDGGVSWSLQTAGSQDLLAITAAQGSNAFTAGALGSMYRTTANGIPWLGRESGTTIRLNCGAWTGPTSGIVVGASGRVMLTNDSGDTWSSRMLGTQDLYGAKFGDSTAGWIVGAGGAIYKTVDGGASWAAQTSGTTRTLRAVSTVDSQTAVAIGEAGTILRTTNGGTTWTALRNGANNWTNKNLNDVFCLNATTWWTVGADRTVLLTTNGGATWAAPADNMGGWGQADMYSVWLTDANHIWIVGEGGRYSYSTDGGASFAAVRNAGGTSLDLHSVAMADSTTGWAVGGGSANSVILRTVDGGVTWTAQSAGFSGTLRRVTVANSSIAGLVGDGGVMRRTFDGGVTWQPCGVFILEDLNHIATPVTGESWAVGDGGVIGHTHDDGASWGTQQSGVTDDLYGVDFVSSNQGWAVGAGGRIITSASHSTWRTQTSNTTQDLRGVDFVDVDRGWAVGAAGTIRRTLNGGATWTAQTSNSPTTLLYGVAALDSQTVYAWGSGGRVIKTVNGGTTWTPTASPGATDLYGGSFLDAQTGWVAGANGAVYKTTDGGATWTPQTSGFGTASIRDVEIVNQNLGYLVGDGGTIRVTLDGGATWFAQMSGTSNSLAAVDFSEPGEGRIVGVGGTILGTTSNTAPTTTLVVDPPAPNGTNDWYVGRPELTFVSDQPGLTYYSWVSASGPWTVYSQPISPAFDGTGTIYWYSVNAGAVPEAPKSQTGKVDATPPTTPTTLTAQPDSTSSAYLTWGAGTDACSGVAYYAVYDVSNDSLLATSTVTTCTVPGLTGGQSYGLAVTTFDIAGNESLRSEVTTVTPPSSSIWMTITTPDTGLNLDLGDIDPETASMTTSGTVVTVGGVGAQAYDLSVSAGDFTSTTGSVPPTMPPSVMSWATRGQAVVGPTPFSTSPSLVWSSTVTDRFLWQQTYIFDYTMNVGLDYEPGAYTAGVVFTLVQD